MKLMTSNILGSNLTVNSANSEYPLANLLNNYPKIKWKSVTINPTFTIDCSVSSAMVLFIAGHNFENLKFTFKNEIHSTLLEETINLLSQPYRRGSKTDNYNMEAPVWIPLDFTPAASRYLYIQVYADNSQIIPEIGIMRLGLYSEFRAINGLDVDLKDNSIVKALVSGSSYTKYRESQRQFKVSLVDDIDDMAYAGMPAIYASIKGLVNKCPVPVMLLSASEYITVVFGTLSNFSFKYGSPAGRCKIDFTITEQI